MVMKEVITIQVVSMEHMTSMAHTDTSTCHRHPRAIHNMMDIRTQDTANLIRQLWNITTKMESYPSIGM